MRSFGQFLAGSLFGAAGASAYLIQKPTFIHTPLNTASLADNNNQLQAATQPVPISVPLQTIETLSAPAPIQAEPLKTPLMQIPAEQSSSTTVVQQNEKNKKVQNPAVEPLAKVKIDKLPVTKIDDIRKILGEFRGPTIQKPPVLPEINTGLNLPKPQQIISKAKQVALHKSHELTEEAQKRIKLAREAASKHAQQFSKETEKIVKDAQKEIQKQTRKTVEVMQNELNDTKEKLIEKSKEVIEHTKQTIQKESDAVQKKAAEEAPYIVETIKSSLQGLESTIHGATEEAKSQAAKLSQEAKTKIAESTAKLTEAILQRTEDALHEVDIKLTEMLKDQNKKVQETKSQAKEVIPPTKGNEKPEGGD